MQLVGLKSCHAGNPLPKGVKDTGAEALLKALTKITQPYQGGVTFNFSNPTSNKFYREGEADPFFSMRDPTSGSKEVTWNVADFDDDTLEMYFGTTEPAEGKLYEGEKAFVFDAESGASIAFARLKYTASLSGSLNTSDPLQIAVSADVLAPEQGGIAWWPIATPEYTESSL
ncbi:hypothetical protein [Alistipes communis]|jgi:hypothetical protein|uniref:hypothetical protein n=1 Tax=Alistipes communis TaxID=2585118 RepID=UPI00294304D6|nr:hypothetical protein [Alistipes communis]